MNIILCFHSIKKESVVSEKVASSHGMSHLVLPVEGNVVYHQWSIGGVRAIIRAKYHGFVPQQVCNTVYEVKHRKTINFLKHKNHSLT